MTNLYEYCGHTHFCLLKVWLCSSLWFLEYDGSCCYPVCRALVKYFAWKTCFVLKPSQTVGRGHVPCVLHVQPCVVSCWGYGCKPSTALLMSLAARCGLRGLGMRGPGPTVVAEVKTNMQPPPINQLIDNLTSSCRCLLDDLRRLPEVPFRCGLCVVPLLWQLRFPRVLDVRQVTRHCRTWHIVMVSRQSYIVCRDLQFYLWTLMFFT